MKKIILAAIILISSVKLSLAQNAPADVNTVIDAEKNFDKLVERKGIKGGFLAVADPEGIDIVFETAGKCSCGFFAANLGKCVSRSFVREEIHVI